MKLYYTKGACSLAAHILINELSLPCEYEAVDLKTKKTEQGSDFLTINPKGAVPTLETNDGEILTENAVIHQYLADKKKAYNLLPPIEEFKRYRVLEWENYITTELHKSFGALFNPNISKDLQESIFIPMIKNKFAFVDKQLQNKSYLLGDEFTLPDAYLFVMLSWARHFKIDLDNCPNLSDYFKNLSKRASVQKSLQEEGLQ
ncbi:MULTISPECIES: glutathione transferase GstA [Legionella]|uniref:glutathione transferase GstA n=1 Tax=Legionella TaxID=445 RepID=UPI000F8CF63A|nr:MULTISPECIES: glutathione transferase GstA [Legionella]MCP0914426.1 glutathione transferase GstA [Legionella sp. 27cVA30]RUR10520.1 glutathione transferase GstA [Legionella septentrionalis]RUR16140.1 glutathione transferase GstA [Legionella septentrionalis]